MCFCFAKRLYDSGLAVWVYIRIISPRRVNTVNPEPTGLPQVLYLMFRFLVFASAVVAVLVLGSSKDTRYTGARFRVLGLGFRV